MNYKKAVKVGDRIFYWDLDYDKFAGCEFKKLDNPVLVEIIKVPDPKPEIPDEPRTRGSVVTFEGHDECVAVRFTGADDMPYPFVAMYACTGTVDLFEWKGIVSHASGRKIIVHKTVDPNEAPVKVNTYAEWAALPEDELKKYKWKDNEGDLWFFSAPSGEFVVYGGPTNNFTLGNQYFPMIRDEKIDD